MIASGPPLVEPSGDFTGDLAEPAPQTTDHGAGPFLPGPFVRRSREHVLAMDLEKVLQVLERGGQVGLRSQARGVRERAVEQRPLFGTSKLGAGAFRALHAACKFRIGNPEQGADE